MKSIIEYDNMDSMYSETQQRVMSRCDNRHSSGSYTSQSVLTAVQKFVKRVESMNETVMVPSRLLDMNMSNSQNRPLPELLRDEKDPYAVYGLLNSTKNDLLYGIAVEDDDDEKFTTKPRIRRITHSDRWSSPVNSTDYSSNSYRNINNKGNTNSTTLAPKHQQTPSRRESTLSMMSVNSSNSDSSTESDIIEESHHDNSSDGTDSALGADDAIPDPVIATSVSESSQHLKGHLIGLFTCLTQLSDTATYITDRYQDEIVE